MSVKKVAYYNMLHSTEYENALLKEWGIHNISLTSIPKKAGVSTEEAVEGI